MTKWWQYQLKWNLQKTGGYDLRSRQSNFPAASFNWNPWVCSLTRNSLNSYSLYCLFVYFPDDYVNNVTLGHILELLTFCVEHHTYHIKNYVISKDLLRRVLVLMKSQHKFLVLSKFISIVGKIIIFLHSQDICPSKSFFSSDILQIGLDITLILLTNNTLKVTKDVLVRSAVIVSDHNVKLSGILKFGQTMSSDQLLLPARH